MKNQRRFIILNSFELGCIVLRLKPLALIKGEVWGFITVSTKSFRYVTLTLLKEGGKLARLR